MTATLAIVGCGPRLEVALGVTGVAPGVVALAGPTPRSDLIMAAVDLLLRAADLDRADLTGILATRGPGSFTGVRVALATAQGLGLALGVPAAGVGSLLAQAARCTAAACLAVQPARRGQVYVQPFRRENGELLGTAAPRVLAVDELASQELPVIAPTGLVLPAGVVLAPSHCTTAEALLDLPMRLASTAADSLTPFYLEPPPAVPPVRTAKPWPLSPKAS